MPDITLTLTPEDATLLRIESQIQIDNYTSYMERTHDERAFEYIEMWERVKQQLTI